MSAYYVVNTKQQPNDDHEVHWDGCNYLPHPSNRHNLGVFDNCHAAVLAAKRIYPKSNGCFHCSRPCHTS